MCTNRVKIAACSNGHGKYATPDNETGHARFPDEPTSHSTSLPKDSNQVAGYLPIPLPQAGEGAYESLREFHVKKTIRNKPSLCLCCLNHNFLTVADRVWGIQNDLVTRLQTGLDFHIATIVRT